MENDALSDAALVLLGHGSTVHPGAARTVLQHAAELRRRRLFAEVREAFWKQEPQVVKVLSNLPQSRVVIVPMFMSEGYFSEEIIPRNLGLCQPGQGTLGRRREDGRQTVLYSRRSGPTRP